MPQPIQEQLRASGESSQKTASGNQSLRGPILSKISIFLCVIDLYINAHICKLLNTGCPKSNRTQILIKIRYQNQQIS